jgi:hypothetical protein
MKPIMQIFLNANASNCMLISQEGANLFMKYVKKGKFILTANASKLFFKMIRKLSKVQISIINSILIFSLIPYVAQTKC